jgi:hypothetical protein
MYLIKLIALLPLGRGFFRRYLFMGAFGVCYMMLWIFAAMSQSEVPSADWLVFHVCSLPGY